LVVECRQCGGELMSYCSCLIFWLCGLFIDTWGCVSSMIIL